MHDIIRIDCRIAPAPHPTTDRDRGDDAANRDNRQEDRLEQPDAALDFRNPN
jgi:hypothetical protein